MIATRSCRAMVLALALGLAATACTDHLAGITGTTSIKVDLVSPADTGSITNRLQPTQNTLTVNLSAIDANGKPDTNYSNQLQVYVQYLGTLTPDPDQGQAPLQVVQMAGGSASNVFITLPPAVYGPVVVWFDDAADVGKTYATGVSPTLWYRDPFVVDIETPTSETSVDAFYVGPLDNKNVAVKGSRYGAQGRLVVTSVFSQGYTVADVNCADANGTPPCVSADYDYLEIFSYSAPLDQDKRFISEGQVIDGFAGGVTEFDGLTEIGFPQTFISTIDINTAREPVAVKLDPLTWFSTNKIEFERNEGGAIEIDNAKVCPLDNDYVTYKQWKIDPAGVADPATCTGDHAINVITTGLQLDPATLVGKTLPKVVGMLRPINIGSFNIWIIYPRSLNDIVTP